MYGFNVGSIIKVIDFQGDVKLALVVNTYQTLFGKASIAIIRTGHTTYVLLTGITEASDPKDKELYDAINNGMVGYPLEAANLLPMQNMISVKINIAEYSELVNSLPIYEIGEVIGGIQYAYKEHPIKHFG